MQRNTRYANRPILFPATPATHFEIDTFFDSPLQGFLLGLLLRALGIIFWLCTFYVTKLSAMCSVHVFVTFELNGSFNLDRFIE